MGTPIGPRAFTIPRKNSSAMRSIRSAR
jgi:hypothetical protein